MQKPRGGILEEQWIKMSLTTNAAEKLAHIVLFRPPNINDALEWLTMAEFDQLKQLLCAGTKKWYPPSLFTDAERKLFESFDSSCKASRAAELQKIALARANQGQDENNKKRITCTLVHFQVLVRHALADDLRKASSMAANLAQGLNRMAPGFQPPSIPGQGSAGLQKVAKTQETPKSDRMLNIWATPREPYNGRETPHPSQPQPSHPSQPQPSHPSQTSENHPYRQWPNPYLSKLR